MNSSFDCTFILRLMTFNTVMHYYEKYKIDVVNLDQKSLQKFGTEHFAPASGAHLRAHINELCLVVMVTGID